jgi:hypothetical protein
MADTYDSIADVADSASLARRVTAAAAQQGQTEPERWTYEHRWVYGAAPGWGAAFASAEAAGNPDPGAAPDVITDGMILSQVQSMLGGQGAHGAS